MNHASNVSNCPKCGATELGKGKHSGYSVMSPVNKLSLGCNIEYIFVPSVGLLLKAM